MGGSGCGGGKKTSRLVLAEEPAHRQSRRFEQTDQVLFEARVGQRVDEDVAAMIQAEEDVVEEERIGQEFWVMSARRCHSEIGRHARR